MNVGLYQMNSVVSHNWADLCAHVCSLAHNRNIVCVYWMVFTGPFRFISRQKRPECERQSAKPLRKLSWSQNSQCAPPPKKKPPKLGAWLTSENVMPDAHWQPGMWSMSFQLSHSLQGKLGCGGKHVAPRPAFLYLRSHWGSLRQKKPLRKDSCFFPE